MQIGGPAKYFFVAKTEKKLIEAMLWAKDKKIKCKIIGEGSNIVASDKGYHGLIIQNSIKHIQTTNNKVNVGSGKNLLKFIFKLNSLGLTGMEKMAGIPGTIGGAIYGCAGAYGQEIKDCLLRVKVVDASAQLSTSNPKAMWLTRNRCEFDYRNSIFKKNLNWVILGAEFKFKKENPKKLKKISSDIIKLREQKYQPGLLCPGSFFKNIILKDLPAKTRIDLFKKIDKGKIKYGKLASGYLLDLVGAKGVKTGKIKVADYHGNLILNQGGGKASDVAKIAKILKNKVRKEFGIELEEEVQYLK